MGLGFEVLGLGFEWLQDEAKLGFEEFVVLGLGFVVLGLGCVAGPTRRRL